MLCHRRQEPQATVDATGQRRPQATTGATGDDTGHSYSHRRPQPQELQARATTATTDDVLTGPKAVYLAVYDCIKASNMKKL